MGRTIFARIVLAATLLYGGIALTADVKTEPRFDLRIEQNDNFDLDPEGGANSNVLGYIAEMELGVRIATPRGETSLLPRIRVQEYPDRSDFERFEGFLDMASRYEWERSNFEFEGHFAQQDLYNADTPGGGFDPNDPGGGNPDSGALAIGQTRTRLDLRPTFEHRINERTGIGFVVDYLATRYDANGGESTRTDYDYGVARGYLSWALSPQSDISAGAYTTSYETTDGNETTDAVGGELGYTHRWSATDGIEAVLYYESNDTKVALPSPFKETSSDFGGALTAYRKLEVSEWRLTVGRVFIPTGDNGKATSDQFRIQYDRLLSQRLSFSGAARYDSRSSLSVIHSGSDRDYARLDLSLKWLMTRSWYIGGGYSYIWEDREQATSDAANNKLFINFGYQGHSQRSLSDIR